MIQGTQDRLFPLDGVRRALARSGAAYEKAGVRPDRERFRALRQCGAQLIPGVLRCVERDLALHCGRPMSEVRIRQFTPEDAQRVKAITLEGFAAVSLDAAIERRWPGLLPTSWGERKWQMMRPEIERHPERCFVAEIAGEVVGYVTTSVALEHGVGRVPDLAVDARMRGRGIGRQLLAQALESFRAMGLKLARIETLAHNEVGQHLYPSVGFIEVARQVHFALPLVPPEGETSSS